MNDSVSLDIRVVSPPVSGTHTHTHHMHVLAPEPPPTFLACDQQTILQLSSIITFPPPPPPLEYLFCFLHTFLKQKRRLGRTEEATRHGGNDVPRAFWR